jgi:phage tail-like protein
MTFDYPSPSFYFKVKIAGAMYSFKEVDGISVEMDIEEIAEGGENGFKHKVPTRPKFSNLELKRGFVPKDSMLGKLCSSILINPSLNGFKRTQILVHLLDEKGAPAISWSFNDAWPISWSIGKFDAMENSYAVESIKFSYSYFNTL